MEQCFNCFDLIRDMRKETRCSSCQQPIHKECAIEGTLCDVCYTVKQEGGDQVAIELPKTIRRSYIELYKKCPYSFYLQVIKGMEAPPTAYTQVGIDLHDLFDQAQNRLVDSKSEMVERFLKVWDNYNPSLFETSEFKEKMYVRAMDSIDTFYDILPTLPPLVATEEKIEFSIGEDIPTVNITMDRISQGDQGLEISDWKTGAVMVGQKLSTDLQAPLYIHAVRTQFKQHVQKFHLYYLQENKERVFEHVVGDDYVCRVNKREYKINITDAIREVQKLFSRMKNGEYNIPRDTKKMYFACKMCHLKADGTCKGADEESWYQYHRGGA